jgi:hypothetical protein
MVSFTLVSTQFANTLFSYSVVILDAAYLVVEAMDSKSRHQVSKGVVCTHPFGVTHGVGVIELQLYFLPLSIQLLQKVIIGCCIWQQQFKAYIFNGICFSGKYVC